MKELRFAIIGCGRIAQRHAEHIVKKGKLVAVCDMDKGRRNELAEKHACKAYATLDELLQQEKELDLVSVCTPNALHAEQSIQVLKAGIHVLC